MMSKIKLFVSVGLLLLCGSNIKAQEGFSRSAMEIVNDMSPGWNLGNTLEAFTTWTGAALWNNKGGLAAETGWQSTKTTPEIIAYVKSLGFKSVRIPCAWAAGHISDTSTYEIDAAWMARVKEIVDYCIDEGLYVVINDHWDGGWLEEHIKDSDPTKIGTNKYILKTLWTQIAETFKDYDEHLLFAGLNEPNADLQSSTNNLIQYNQTFVDAVRETGGNNAQRVLVVQGPSTNIDHTCNFMAGKMPTDVVEGKLAIEVHYYNPWQFWGMEKDESWGKVFYYWGAGNHHSGSQHNATWGEETEMKNQLQKMKTNFVDKGYPVVIGEFGANWRDLSGLEGESQEKHNQSIKSHYRELFRLTKEMGGMVPMVWDTNYTSQNGTKGSMTIIDRTHLTIFGTYAMEGINEIYPRPSESGINSTALPSPTNSHRYNLQGIRISENQQPSQGIYIQAGKKVVARGER